jgi:MATE family multidrug resistance protein
MRKEIKETLDLGWPIILGNLSQMFLGVIDSAMVGAIHSSQLAAASFVNNLLTIPLVLGFGLTMAVSPLVAHAIGLGDDRKPLLIAVNGLFVAFVMMLVLAIGIELFQHNLLHSMGQDDIVVTLSGPYLRWMTWSMLPMILFMVLKQFSDGLGETRWPMYLALITLPVNGFLNYLFIFGKFGFPRMEVAGAGVATFISRLLLFVAIILLILFKSTYKPYLTDIKHAFFLKLSRIREILRVGVPSAVQYGMEAGAFAVSGVMSGWLGYVQQAAHQIALNMAAVTYMVSLGISSAGSIRVANAKGQGNTHQVKQIGYSNFLMAVCYGLFCAVLLYAGRNALPPLFNNENEVLRYTVGLLILAGIFQISDSTQAVGIGLLRGIQDMKIPTLIVLIAYWLIGIPIGYFLAFHLNWEVYGLWVGFIVGLSASALLLFFRFRYQTNE